MKASLATSTWTCPACGERVPYEIKTKLRRGRLGRAHTVTVTIPDSWLADVYAHVWTCGGSADA